MPIAGVVFATGAAAYADEWISGTVNCAQTYQRAKVVSNASAAYREHWRVDYGSHYTLYGIWTTSGSKTTDHGGGSQRAYVYTEGTLYSQSATCVAA